MLQAVDRLIHPAHRKQDLTQAIVGCAGIGPQRKRGTEIGEAIISFPLLVERPRQFKVHPEIFGKTMLRGGEQCYRISAAPARNSSQRGHQLWRQESHLELLSDSCKLGAILPCAGCEGGPAPQGQRALWAIWGACA